ncbi:TetR/AcrR family transcriptional regulator [Tropicibacter oceani]|uniref:TetR family transcriptional regulator n=1 Tax=Tropicibacter oceani TaxID=3058420 RepID=A0ABY8QMR9_9RHOB|nr:TetR family transcriptional regulator [Tropicibacter oceani]WGW05929.1 TetR family transcriptional regulator [Tropicibacter oceani]
MDELKQEILDAALQVFSRYGVKRTSMGDLCQEAGVSRQTLYNRFRNKDDILRDLIGRYTDAAIDEIRQGLEQAESLGDRLDIFFDRMALNAYDIVQAMPNAEEFIEGVNAVSQEALEQSACRFQEVLAEVLEPHQAALARAGLGVADLSNFAQRSAKAATSHARDRADLVSQLRTLRQLCLSVAGQRAPDATHTGHDENAN